MRIKIAKQRDAKQISLANAPAVTLSEKPLYPCCPCLYVYGAAAKKLLAAVEASKLKVGDTAELEVTVRLKERSEYALSDGTTSAGLTFEVQTVETIDGEEASEADEGEAEKRAKSLGTKECVIAKRFDFEADLGSKSVTGYRAVRDEKSKEIVDYKDVVISGYLTTWQHVTPKDRDGEYVMKGAFTKCLKGFMQNPVMLRDHQNKTDNIAGSFVELAEDDDGLRFKARLSNAPNMKDTRINVVDGHLKTVSMGGAFTYDRSGKGIKEVALYEGTLTPVPANPDARFRVSDVSPEGKAYIERGGTLQGLKAFEAKPTVEKGDLVA